MKQNTDILSLSECSVKLFRDDIPIRGIGYISINKCPKNKLDHVCEYTIHCMLKYDPEKLMIGFKKDLYRKKNLGKIQIQHKHNMITMQKKLINSISQYEPSFKFKKITFAEIETYIEMYRKVFWDVPNASFYRKDDILNLLSRNNYDICFFYHNKTLIGFCEYQISEKNASIEAIGILQQYREKGYARALLHNLYYILTAENIEVIELTASSMNIPAVTLYKKEGFRVRKTLSYWYEVIY